METNTYRQTVRPAAERQTQSTPFTLIELLACRGVACLQAARSQAKTMFTLIELLVVIAIIAILAAMLFPALARARIMAQRALCQSNHKQVYAAVSMYSMDYEGYWPCPNRWGANYGILAYSGTMSYSLGLTFDYTKNGVVYQCPTIRQTNDMKVSADYLGNQMAKAIRQKTGAGYTSYYLERTWDGDSTNHIVWNPSKKPYFGYRYVGSLMRNNINNTSGAPEQKRFKFLPMFHCFQDPVWSKKESHSGKAVNITYTDGAIVWYEYPYTALHKHSIHVNWNTMIALRD